MRHAVDSWSGQHAGNRDDPQRSECFAVAGGGAHGRRQAGAAHSGDCHRAGRVFVAVGRAGRWHRPADARGLYASLQYRWLGGARRPAPAGRRLCLAEAQRSEVAKRGEDGPDRKTDGGVRWRWADLGDRIAAKFDVTCMSAASASCRRSGISAACRGVPCTCEAALRHRRLCKNFAGRARAAIPRELAGRPVELWFSDCLVCQG